MPSYRAKETWCCLATSLQEIPGFELDSHGRSDSDEIKNIKWVGSHGRNDSDEKRILRQISLLSPIFHASHAGFKKLTSMFWGEEKWNQAQIQYGETTDERCITCPEVRDIPQESKAKIKRKIGTNKYIVSYSLKIKKQNMEKVNIPLKTTFSV